MSKIIKWSEDEDRIILDNVQHKTFEQIAEMLPQRTRNTIQRRYFKLRKEKSVVNPNLSKDSLKQIFEKYKRILNGHTNRGLTNDKHTLKYLFKYYLRKNNISTNRKYITDNYIIGNILKEAKLKTLVKRNFDNYFHFISFCFPMYNFREWEFKNLDVSPDYWESKENRFDCIRTNLNILIDNGILKNEEEVLSLPIGVLAEYFHGTLLYKFKKQAFNEYLSENGIIYNEEDFKFLDGYRFDSYEELYLYKVIKGLGFSVIKPSKKDKIFNSKHNESYIPDFIIDDDIYVEYYGLWKNKGVEKSQGYNDKTRRKNEFYKNNNYKFIAIYPRDLKSSSSDLKNKILREVI